MENLCAGGSRSAALRFLKRHRATADLVSRVMMNLTNDERDQLNVWNNLRDRNSEQEFFRDKLRVRAG